MSVKRLALGAATLLAGGCALRAIPCDEWQKTHEVIRLEGRVGPGETRTHLVPYDQRWSQNDLRITWTPARKDGGLAIAVYATSAECTGFDPEALLPRRVGPYGRHNEPRVQPPAVITPSHPCEQIGSRGGWMLPNSEWTQTSVIVPGGPRQRRPYLHQYLLHVIAGDGNADAAYAILITWGPRRWQGCAHSLPSPGPTIASSAVASASAPSP